MRKTKSKPSSSQKTASKPRRSRSAPAKMGSRKKSKSRKKLTVLRPTAPQWDPRAANPDQYSKIQMAKQFYPVPPQLNPRAAHPDQYMRIQIADDYFKGKKFPASYVKVVKKRG